MIIKHINLMDLKVSSVLDNARKYADIFVDGMNQAVTPFHAVEYLKNQLLANDFQELKEK